MKKQLSLADEIQAFLNGGEEVQGDKETQIVSTVSKAEASKETPNSSIPTTLSTLNGKPSKAFTDMFGSANIIPPRPPDGIMPEDYDVKIRAWLRGLEPEHQKQFADNTLAALHDLSQKPYGSDVELWQEAERRAASVLIKFHNPQPKQRAWA